ncbi:MAG: hydantoinase B/oxoprolinase family protein [Candidatus Tectomicrobia bacterium]|nr:hydantoinase B/oxoprolinase family protein [Candidatus Tectomicrobia bacterium]
MDPILFEVLKHKLLSITWEQGNTLKKVSGSPVVTEANDFNTGLYLADGSIVTLGRQMIWQTGAMANVIRSIISDCSENPGIGEGDMFICNDPYKGALHGSDVSLAAPVFHEGKRVAWVGTVAHQVDMGGMDVGSWCPRATERVQESMNLPPLKLVEAGRVRQDVWNAILSMTRLPFLLGLDLRAMTAANNTAKARLTGLIERYGAEAVLSAMEGLIRLSEQRLRSRLRRLPDGVYRAVDFLDHDGHQDRTYKVAVSIEKAGDRLTFDFSESADQAPGFINCTRSGLVGAVCTALFTIVAYDIPWTEGLLRPVRILAPEGKICSARPPAPVSMATCGVMYCVNTVCVLALSRMMGADPAHRPHLQAATRGAITIFNLGGWNQYKERFGTMLLDSLAGGGGAFSYKDGVHAAGSHPIPIPNIANVETTENIAPILYLYRSLIPDTGGPGRHRGGVSCGLAFTVHDVEELSGVLVSHGTKVPNAQGLSGGLPAACTVNTLIRGSDVLDGFQRGRLPGDLRELRGTRVNLGSKPGRVRLARGDVFENSWQGGGGYGDPLDRDPRQVSKDVRAGLVSPEAARKIYGVALDPRTGEARETATGKLRDGIRRRRLTRPASGRGGNSRRLKNPLDGRRVGSLGEFIQVVRDGKRLLSVCECGTVLSDAGSNWKEGARRVRLSHKELGPLIWLHEDLEVRAYYCPNCGRQHAVEVTEKGAPPLFEIELRF